MSMQSDAKNLPTEPGWYFARHNSGGKMICAEVFLEYGMLRTYGISLVTHEIENYKWFGKVPMPVEID